MKNLHGLIENDLIPYYGQIELIKKFDFDTYLHSLKVVELVMPIGITIGLSEAEINCLQTAAVLHDIGKTKISPQILHKRDPLNAADMIEIFNHPGYGADILRPLVQEGELPMSIVQAVYGHHEHYNGNGYPTRRKGEDIPVMARIISIADAMDAMTRPRPYRPYALSVDEAIGEIEIHSGTQFDPYLVKAFKSSYKK